MTENQSELFLQSDENLLKPSSTTISKFRSFDPHFAMKKIFLLIRLARDNNMFDSFATTLYRSRSDASNDQDPAPP